jgi:hypothetical protein
MPPPVRPHQEGERKSSLLPWLIGLALLAALLFFGLRGCDDRDNEAVPVADTMAPA